MISWQTLAIAAAMTSALIGPMGATFVKDDLRMERRLYWGGWLSAAAFTTAAIWERGWEGRLGGPLLCLFIAGFYAYTRTPYLKIGDRIYAWRQSDIHAGMLEDDRKPLSPSGYSTDVTVAKTWWLFAGLSIWFGVWVFSEGWHGWPIFGVAVCSVTGLIAGIDDGTRMLPPVRGQRVQGFVSLIASIPMFGTPPIAYTLGYQLGLHRPVGHGRHAGPN